MTPALPTKRSRVGAETGLLVAILVTLWAIPFVIVAPLWPTAVYYDYAPTLPLIAGFLLWRRRAELQACRFDRLHGLDAIPLALGLGALALMAYVAAGTASWRIINVGSGLAAAGLTLYLLYRLGGLRPALGLLGIVALLLTAFPWPMPLEQPVIDHFTQAVIAFNAQLLPLFGLPAIVSGNRLLVEGQVVSVAEACSGLKSLQMLLAFALFSGEFGRLRVVARVVLVAAVFPVAFAVNVGRASFLAFASFGWGHEAYERWHDPVGYLSFAVSGGILLFLTNRFPSGSGIRPEVPPVSSRPGPKIAALGGLAALGLLLGTLLFVRGQENPAPVALATLRLPSAWSVTGSAVPDEAREMLLCEELHRYSFPTGEGRQADVYLMLWDDLVAGYTDVSIHRPDVCMVQYQGGQLIEGPLLRSLPNTPTADPVQFWRIRYAQSGTTLRVYRLVGQIREGQLDSAGWAQAVGGGFTFARKRELALATRTDRSQFFAVLVGLDAALSPAASDEIAAEIFTAAVETLVRQ